MSTAVCLCRVLHRLTQRAFSPAVQTDNTQEDNGHEDSGGYNQEEPGDVHGSPEEDRALCYSQLSGSLKETC